MKRDLWDRFASKLNSVDEAPEPLCSAMQAALKPDDAIRLLIFGPGFTSLGKSSIATLLAVIDSGWIVVSGMEAGQLRVDRARFADTLLVEVTIILLYGRLKFDYTADGGTRSAMMEFSTVMEPLYKEAARLALDGIEGAAGTVPIADGHLNALLDGVPMKFRSAAHEFRPPAQPVLALRHWPPVMGKKRLWFQRELATEAMLMLTEHELIFISEEKTWSWMWIGRVNKYGYVVTYCPLSRLENWHIEANEKLATLDLSVCAQQGGETVRLEFPRGKEHHVATLMRQQSAMSQT
jgi:hypothetical protein